MRHVLNEEIQPVKGIQRTETIISLEQSIDKQIFSFVVGRWSIDCSRWWLVFSCWLLASLVD